MSDDSSLLFYFVDGFRGILTWYTYLNGIKNLNNVKCSYPISFKICQALIIVIRMV